MMKIETVATVYYTCTLSDEEEKLVVEYVKEFPEIFEFMDERRAILRAVEVLWGRGKINLYEESIESDFCTSEIKWSEFEHRTPEEILGE